ncbi:MAG: C-GCAxxG-C-C family protein [Anaeromyxobacter sp.]
MTREELVVALRERARFLYDGKETPHRSCGIALAETFGRPTAPYQALRRGGITGHGTCGAVVAGQLILGELLGDPSPTGAVTPALRAAMTAYEAEIRRRLDRPSYVCDDLVRAFGEFQSPERHAHCTDLAATVAEVVADVLAGSGVPLDLERLVRRP